MKLFLLLISVLILGVNPNISKASPQSATVTVNPKNVPAFVEKNQTTNDVVCGFCESYEYSPWGACQSNNQQSRTLTKALPEGCTPAKNIELTRTCSFCPNCQIAGLCQTGGGCDASTGQCIPVVNVPSGQDPNNQCTPAFKACSGNTKIGPDGNCDGAGACKLSGLAEACQVAGTNETGGGCQDGACLAVIPKFAQCGNNSCESGETCFSCPGDCGACTYCGDGIIQQPNSMGIGGTGNGYEQCDGSAGITDNPYQSSIYRQYGCINQSCVFKDKKNGGGYCGDGFCQTKYENNTNCSTDCNDSLYKWKYSDWGECDKDCGGGIKKRTVDCISTLDGSVVSNSYCEGMGLKKDVLETECNVQACTTYEWKYFDEDWSSCSKDCGSGTRSREPKCVISGSADIVADKFCLQGTLNKFIQEESCNTQACTTYDWIYSDWSNCSKDCGGGQMTRSSDCISTLDDNLVDDKYCIDLGLEMEVLEKSCNTQSCASYEWKYFDEDWSACSVECGGGKKSREARCVISGSTQIVSDSLCLGGDTFKPSERVDCNTQACVAVTYSVKVSDWGECSAPCGGGNQTRTYWCESSLGQVVDNSYCNITIRSAPLTMQSCNTMACDVDPISPYKWVYSDWYPDCTPTNRVQYRDVSCYSNLTEAVVDKSYCQDLPMEYMYEYIDGQQKKDCF